jgi:hypothetical protein
MLTRCARGSCTDMLEAFLTTRIGVSVAGPVRVTVSFSVLHKRHNSLLNFHHRRSSIGWRVMGDGRCVPTATVTMPAVPSATGAVPLSHFGFKGIFTAPSNISHEGCYFPI